MSGCISYGMEVKDVFNVRTRLGIRLACEGPYLHMTRMLSSRSLSVTVNLSKTDVFVTYYVPFGNKDKKTLFLA